jgi:hypothetical protein
MDGAIMNEVWDAAEELTAPQRRSLEGRSSRKLQTYRLWKSATYSGKCKGCGATPSKRKQITPRREVERIVLARGASW